ncbi:MAG TPA: S-layer homology domain-containing protein [Ideonella sp.]|uniref:S-layer homology domain-containing protein n=1 Tax=Ideonella sp. TaxID=1929293 RepID=UPI002BB261C5|nr:S-layer homology domain-containing protein [Ideonella sp.]HSI48832.1 S-layer homology domain-containing protein [Ideonella sp.]
MTQRRVPVPLDTATLPSPDAAVPQRMTRRFFGKLLGAPAILGSTVTLSACDDGNDPAPAPAPPPAPAALSRAAFVATIADSFDWVHSSQYNDQYKAVQPTFADVLLGVTPYARQIETALEEGVVSNAQGDFRPEAAVTREDAAEMYALAFKVPAATTDALAAFGDASSVSASRRASVNAMLAAGYMAGTTATTFQPAGTLTAAEAAAILAAIQAKQVSPPQVMCKAGTTAPRRYVRISTPTEGATIYYTFTYDGSEPPDPLTAGAVYDFTVDGVLQFVNPLSSTTDSRLYRLKAVAKKDGLATSAVREFMWNIVRPQVGNFQARLMHAGTATTPTVWKINNPAEYYQAFVFYIEGSSRGLVFDCGEYGYQKANLKAFIDTLATKPYDVMVGHNHPDHAEQIYNFTSAGVTLYASAIEKAAFMASSRPDFQAAGTAAVAIADGQVLDLGNVQGTAWVQPGHTNGTLTFIVNQTGWVFGSDMWGCNRPHTADTTQYQSVKVDLFLSLTRQLIANYRRSSTSGEIVEVTNAHQEVSVGMACINNFVTCFQQLIDGGNAVALPSIRGGTKVGDRMSIVGDMWRDKNWLAIGPIGKYAAPVDYFSKPTTAYPCNVTVDYNTAQGYRQYAVLSHIAFIGGTLVGVDVSWAAPVNGTPNTLPDKFDPWTYAYTVLVPRGSSSIVVTPTPLSSKVSAMKLDGAALAVGASASVAVSAGSTFTVELVSADASVSSTYTFTVQMLA